MAYKEIIIPILIFIGLGLVTGILLSVFSKIFAVKTNEQVENIVKALPGLNCGVCGFSGCENYANEIVFHAAKTNRCVPGGDGASKKISEILGTQFEDVEEKVAYVSCNGKVPKVTNDEFIYQGEKTCTACNMYYDGKGICNYGCIGYGDCTKVCSVNAISIVDEVAVVDDSKCIGCTLCARTCPKNIIHIKKATSKVYVSCSSCNNGKETVQTCKNGCIGCKKCENSCPNNAIHVVNNVAVIDYDKCTGCGICVENCPRKCIDISL